MKLKRPWISESLKVGCLAVRRYLRKQGRHWELSWSFSCLRSSSSLSFVMETEGPLTTHHHPAIKRSSNESHCPFEGLPLILSTVFRRSARHQLNQNTGSSCACCTGLVTRVPSLRLTEKAGCGSAHLQS